MDGQTETSSAKDIKNLLFELEMNNLSLSKEAVFLKSCLFFYSWKKNLPVYAAGSNFRLSLLAKYPYSVIFDD